jgi:hypothetical protein
MCVEKTGCRPLTLLTLSSYHRGQNVNLARSFLLPQNVHSYFYLSRAWKGQDGHRAYMHNTEKQEDMFHLYTCILPVYNMTSMLISESTLYIYMNIFKVFCIEKQYCHHLPPGTKRVRGCGGVTALRGLWQFEQAKGWQGIWKEERLR